MTMKRLSELAKRIGSDATQDDEARELANLAQSELQRLATAVATMQSHCNDLERSANSAREIARVAMSNTGTTAIRVELVQTDYGMNLVVCAPASDERDIVSRIVALLNPAIIDTLGIKTDKEPFPIGATG